MWHHHVENVWTDIGWYMNRHSFLMSVCYIPLVQLFVHVTKIGQTPHPIMTTPLGRSNTPSLFGLHITNRPQTFCTLLPTPEGILRCAYTINPSTIAFATVSTSATSKNLHIHLWSHPMPVHLLWQQNQPPLAFKRSIIDRRRDCSIGTVEIWP